MTEFRTEGYRERLSKGDIVYFPAESSGYNLPDGKLVVLKGAIADMSWGRRYPDVKIWDSPTEDPKRTGRYLTMSPRELFTEDETLDALRSTGLPIDRDGLLVDKLLGDPTTHELAVVALGSIVIARLSTPGNPEY